ncbi:hypothetical protein FOL46_009216 [Perkinsus olseni]|uniref:Uncharacterized protein n=1 Tax=Perkinsus olseni TaxID=32597 RepID=A0A7J6L1D9_PEROL|nr:hypothetical protein FOL46_009216 [Perkinsus olseni]
MGMFGAGDELAGDDEDDDVISCMDDDKSEDTMLNDIIESIEYYHTLAVKNGDNSTTRVGKEAITSWLLLWSLYTAKQTAYQFNTLLPPSGSPPRQTSSCEGGWLDIGKRLRWAYCNIPAYRTLLATLRWLRQIQSDDEVDSSTINGKENNNPIHGGVLKALFDILRTDGDDAAIRTLAHQPSGDMYRALELAAVMGAPTLEDGACDDGSELYMDWTEKAMNNTTTNNTNTSIDNNQDVRQEQQRRTVADVIHPVPSRRLLVKEGALAQLSGGGATREEDGTLSDDERAWLGLEYLKGWWDALLRAYANNDDDVMAKEIEARFNTAIQEGLLQVMMDTDDDDTGVMHVYRKSQEAWLAAMSSSSPRLSSSSSSSRILDALTKPLTLLWDWLNNEDRPRQEEDGALFTTSQFAGYLATLYRQEILPYYYYYHTCMTEHEQPSSTTNIDALLNGLIRAKLEVDDDMKYDEDQLSASIIEQSLATAEYEHHHHQQWQPGYSRSAAAAAGFLEADDYIVNLFKERVINASSHIQMMRGTSAQVEAWVWFIRKCLISDCCSLPALASSQTNPVSPNTLQTLFTVLRPLCIIIADKVVVKFQSETAIQVLREVVALCAETSPNDDTLKAAVGVVASSSSSSIQLGNYTPAELVAAVALVRAWWMAYYTQEGDHNHNHDQQQQQQQSLEENASSSNKRGDVDMTTALCACLVYPLLELFILDQKVSSDLLTIHLQNDATPHFWTSMAKTQREISSLRDHAGGRKGRQSISQSDLDDMLSVVVVYETLDSVVWLQSLVQDAILHQRHVQILNDAPQPAGEEEECMLSYKDYGSGGGAVQPLEVRRRMADARRNYERLQSCEEESKNKLIESLRNRVMEYDVFLPTLRKSHQGRLQLEYCAWMAIEIGLSVDDNITRELVDVWLPQSTWLQSSLPSEVTSVLKGG